MCNFYAQPFFFFFSSRCFVVFALTDFSHKPTKSNMVNSKNTCLQGEKLEILFSTDLQKLKSKLSVEQEM